MIENQFNPQCFQRTWTINDCEKVENQKVIRKFINSAIYVEKTVTEMPPLRKTSPISVTDDIAESEVSNDSQNILNSFSNMISKTVEPKPSKCGYKTKNKFSTCYSRSASHLTGNKDESNTSCHQKRLSSSRENESPESGYGTNDQSSTYSSFNGQSENSFQSETTVKAKNFDTVNNFNSELRLSLTCLNTNRTDRTCTLDPKEKQEIVQNWLAKKELEKKRKAMQEVRLAKQKEEERQRLIEKERETFKKWLAEKKKEEERKKVQKELEEQEQKLREAEKEKRKVENEISFNLWLRKKRKYDLERKIKEKLALLHMYKEKQIRIEENEKAYQEWLENAKNRQKPVPMNMGLKSLCSSASVTYINPIPWTPNIDQNSKPTSQ